MKIVLWYIEDTNHAIFLGMPPAYIKKEKMETDSSIHFPQLLSNHLQN